MSEQNPPQPPAGQQPPYAGGPGQPPYGQPPHGQPPYGQPPQGPPPPGYGYGYPAPPPPGVYAEWGQRAVATLWDILYTLPAWLLSLLGGIVLIVGAVLESENEGDGTAFVLIGVLLLLAGTVLGLWLTIKNLILRQGRTGYTWGKAKVGIRVVREVDGQPCGAWSAVGRMFLHSLINQAFYLDYLWPLWDDRNQTLTDKVLSTVVINQPER